MAAQDDGSEHTYFVPMVDMLAGVVFILVILLASTALVQREGFDEVASAQAEMDRIRAELAELRMQENIHIEPRRRAEAALKTLLERLHTRLAAAGVDSDIDVETGQISWQATAAFGPGTASLAPVGREVSAEVAGILDDEIACVARNAPAGPCALYDAQVLQGAQLSYIADEQHVPPELSYARSLTYLSTLVSDRTRLAGLAAADGGKLVTNSTQLAVSPQQGKERVVIQFQMNVQPPQ